MGLNHGYLGVDERSGSTNGIIDLSSDYIQVARAPFGSTSGPKGMMRLSQLYLSRIPIIIPTPYPASQAGVLAWYDADAVDHIVLSGSQVEGWESSGSTSNTATGSSPYPTYATYSVAFTGGSTQPLVLATPIVTARTIFLVVRHSTGSSSSPQNILAGDLYGIGVTNYNEFYGETGTKILSQSFSTSNIVNGTGYVNGTSVGSPLNLVKSTSYQVLCIETAGNTSVNEISGPVTEAWNGSYREIILCDQIYSGSVRNQFISYLRSKWSI